MARNIAQIVLRDTDLLGAATEPANGLTNPTYRRYWYTENPIILDAENTDKFYETYWGLFDTQFWDIRINADSMKGSDNVGLVCVRNEYLDSQLNTGEESVDSVGRQRLDETFELNSNGIYYITFEVIQSKYYTQEFKLLARTAAEDNTGERTVSLGSYSVPAGTGTQSFEAIFVPNQKSLNNINTFESLIFQMQRRDSYNPSMELNSLYIYEMKNLLPTTDNDGLSIKHNAVAATVETTSAGECVLIINDSLFYVGNDKILEIDEEMGVTISGISFLNFTPKLNISDDSSNFVVGLINYKYD